MNVHVLQHVPFEGIGSMEPWLLKRGAKLGYTRFYESSRLPEVRGLDLVIAMGGPMSVNDEETLPWLMEEKRFIREAIQQGVPVLGICLGAQLIASAMGSRVYPSGLREIGWFDIDAMPSGRSHFVFPSKVPVFHWHGETFDLPENAVHLARSAACRNQAFQIGRHVIGLQFHLETTPDSARALVEHCRDELAGGEFVQADEAILNPPVGYYRRINELMEDILEYLMENPDPLSGGDPR